MPRWPQNSPARKARALLSLLEQRLRTGELELTLAEFDRWLRLQRQVEALEAVERARELTRERS